MAANRAAVTIPTDESRTVAVARVHPAMRLAAAALGGISVLMVAAAFLVAIS